MVRGLVVSLAGVISLQAQAIDFTKLNFDQTSCFPKTDVKKFEMLGFTNRSTGISKEAFDRVLDRVAGVYEPIFEAKGLKLTVVRMWDDPRANAGAMPNPENPAERLIGMFGGMARHEKMTEDGFTLVACHEIGHHIGGAPKKEDPRFLWASGEGQSDYFATLKCARKVFAQDDNVVVMKNRQVPEVVLEKCKKSFNGAQDIALCARSGVASKVMGDVGMALLKEQIREQRPDLDVAQIPDPLHTTPDEREVEATDDTHPLPQCRLDTYFQGALCHVGHDVELSDVDAETGACARRLGDTQGVRPLCWYKPGPAVDLAGR